MVIKYDSEHLIECFIDWNTVTPEEVRISGFGVNNEAGAIACAEFSTGDRNKVMYICLWAQKTFIVRMDDMRDPHLTFFADYLGVPIQKGEEDHGDAYYLRTRKEAIGKWWEMVVSAITSPQVAKMYMERPYTVLPTRRDAENLAYDYEHGDISDRIIEAISVVERLR